MIVLIIIGTWWGVYFLVYKYDKACLFYTAVGRAARPINVAKDEYCLCGKPSEMGHPAGDT